jgi:TRAP-type mannitol/chloroaromatic compound transport system substrate-binding protein
MSWTKTKMALAAAALGSTAFTASAPATAAENWSMATPWGGGPLLEYLAKGIGKEVELLTNNEIKVEVFPGGTLGKALKVTDTVKKGVAKMGHNWAGYDWGIDRTAVLFGGFSGTMPWEKMAHWYFRGGGAELLMDWRMEKFGVASIPCGSQPPEVFLHTHRKVASLADYKGIKVRTSGAWAEIAQTMGASTVILPGSEVYPALERKVVDGIEWGTPFMNESAGYEKIAKYVVVPGIHQPSAFHECQFSKAAWDKLDDRTKELMKRAGQTYFFNFWLEVGHKDAPAFQNFKKDSNVEIVDLDAEFKAAAKKATEEWAAKQGEGNEWFTKVWEHQKAYAATWADSNRYRNID